MIHVHFWAGDAQAGPGLVPLPFTAYGVLPTSAGREVACSRLMLAFLAFWGLVVFVLNPSPQLHESYTNCIYFTITAKFL